MIGQVTESKGNAPWSKNDQYILLLRPGLRCSMLDLPRILYSCLDLTGAAGRSRSKAVEEAEYEAFELEEITWENDLRAASQMTLLKIINWKKLKPMQVGRADTRIITTSESQSTSKSHDTST